MPTPTRPLTAQAATAAALTLLLPAGAVLAAAPTRDELVNADYIRGRTAFEQRCSACHTLADGGGNLTGPNLYGIMKRQAGATPGFDSSPALSAAGFQWDPGRLVEFITAPAKLVPGTRMAIPEPVPEADRVPLVAFLMLETGAADWPRPAAAMAKDPSMDKSRPIQERFPSFWNHLMTNTTRYRMETPAGEVRFDAYFNTDGTVTSNDARISGFWQIDSRDFFCYALRGVPAKPDQFIECFPVRAMAIPRFAPELWTSNPTAGVTLHGGIERGRPQPGG
jgi:cytochrome c